jgi:hypothetical protein
MRLGPFRLLAEKHGCISLFSHYFSVYLLQHGVPERAVALSFFWADT